MTKLPRSILESVEQFAKSYNPKGYTDAAIMTAEWLLDHLSELASKEFDETQARVSGMEACSATDIDDDGEKLSFKIGHLRGMCHQHALDMAKMLNEKHLSEITLKALQSNFDLQSKELAAAKAEIAALKKSARKYHEG